MSQPARPFECVYTMPDFCDSPRGGIADFDGRPHAYRELFDHDKDDYTGVFQLRPVDEDTFRLAVENEAISRRWWDAHHSGETDCYPRILPADQARHDEIERQLRARLAALSDPPIHARAAFRNDRGAVAQAKQCHAEVQWTPVDDSRGVPTTS